ncbi:RAM signaling pathway protein-domain-containing protein [Lasiosphaeria hispida]|uniref:RAM signaling pathway protein-domain-containing protein n=1 Tax=Lasiosphaeria hispida TaxID=260671 RepID=A0AAJ0HV81_9PEZI|nr:RAM signaling pathway protein-domain-containing protein [Lasiosphaeria hispida]
MDRKAPPAQLQQQAQPGQSIQLLQNNLNLKGIPSRRLVPPPQSRGVPVAAAATATATTPISPGQVIALVREARKKALADDENRPATDADGLKPGITLDLIRKNIPALPDEVVDILRGGVERLAISHNYLSSLPVRFSQCTSLRYLAARNNAFEVFPLPLCDLISLEFLDLGRNRLRELPPEISKLTSLKAFAIQENQIESLPLGLADMTSLQRLRLAGNPIKFPPREVLQVKPRDVLSNEILSESEVVELMVTDQIKKFLAQRLNAQIVEGASESEGGDDESSEGADTPRLPTSTRRATGRFPIRVKGADTVSSPPVSRSPSLSRPPIPGRSHFRGLSQYSNASTTRKQGIIPLTMGKSTESLRSNPEPARPSQDEQRPESRSSRRAAPTSADDVPPPNLLTVINEPKMNRFSNHLRGFSYSGSLTLTNPFSPEDPSLQRPLYVRELAALPVRKYESRAVDPVLEVARGILYSIFQIHLGVQTLMSLTNDGSARRSSLEMVFYNTNVYFEELEQAIQDYDLASGARGVAREHDGMQRAYTTLIHAYVHICSRLISSVDLLVDNGDQRYMRTFLMHVYHSIMELRVAISGWLSAQNLPSPDLDPPKPRSRAPSAAAEAVRSGSRLRNPKKLGNTPKKQMLVKTDIPYDPEAAGRRAVTAFPARPASAASSSGESFTSAVSSIDSDGGRGRGLHPNPNPINPINPTTTTTTTAASSEPQPDPVSNEADRQFERFYLSLKTATELILRLLPGLNVLFASGLRKARAQLPTPTSTVLNAAEKWDLLLTKGTAVLQQTEFLRDRLSTLRLRDPGLVSGGSRAGGPAPTFWALCNALFGAWAELGDQIKLALVEKLVRFPPGDTVEGLRQISRSMKDSIDLMVVVRRQGMAGSGGSAVGSAGRGVGRGGSRGGSESMSSVGMRFSPPGGQKGEVPAVLPMTPQSAALGYAVRATTRGFSNSP